MLTDLTLYARALTRDAVAAEALLQGTLAEASAERGEAAQTRLFGKMRARFFNTSIRLGPEPALPATSVDLAIPSLATETVTRAVNRLPEHLREVLILLSLLGQRYDEAARVCECREDIFRRRVERARDTVLANLRD